MNNFDLTKVKTDPNGNVFVSGGYTVNPKFLSPEAYQSAVNYASGATGATTPSSPTLSPYSSFFPTATKTDTQSGTQVGGISPNSFTSLLGQIGTNLQYNNQLASTRQLLVKHLFDSKLTPDELSKLPPDVQNVINSGDRNAIELQIRVLNDQIQGRNSTLDKTVSALTKGYEDYQTNTKNAVTQFLAYAQSTGQPLDKVVKALAPIYGINITNSMLNNLSNLGIAVKPQPGVQGGVTSGLAGGYGTATSTISTTLGVDPSTPLSSVIQQNGMDSIVDSIIKNEGSSPQGVLNNPGNIKFTGLPGQINSGVKASDGGTFASYSTPQEGRQAIADLVQNAADGKSSVYGFAPTLGSFVDKYTNTGVDAISSFKVNASYPTDDIKNQVDPQTGLTPLAIYNDAMTWAFENGKLPSVGLGQGVKPSNIRTAVQNKGGAILDSLNLTAPQASAIYAGDKKAVQDNVQRIAKVETITKSVVSQLPRLATMADQLAQQGIELQESDFQLSQAGIERKFGNTLTAQYLELLKTIQADYSANNAALAGSRGGEFFAKQGPEAIPGGLTGDQYLAIMQTMQQSTQNVRSAVNDEIGSLLNRYSGSSSTPSSGTTTDPTSTSGSIDDIFKKYGVQ